MPAACRNLNCDYLYVDVDAQVEQISLLSDTILEIRGVQLPTDDLQSVSLGSVECSSFTQDSPELITCQLSDQPTAGSYTSVNVVGPLGKAKVDAAITPVDVALVVGTVTP